MLHIENILLPFDLSPQLFFGRQVSQILRHEQMVVIMQDRVSRDVLAGFATQQNVDRGVVTLFAYRTAAAYLKANNITKLPSPNKLEAEYCALASEKAQFYEQYKEAKIELLKLKDAKQNVALFFREDERTQHHER